MPLPSITALAFDLADDRDRQDYIQIMMRRRGITIQDIADDQDVVRILVSTVIAGQKKSKRIRIEVARLLGMEFDILWAEPGRGDPQM